MKIISALHIGNDFVNLNAALIDLDVVVIKHIFKIAKKAKEGQTVSEFYNIPVLGTSELFDTDDSGYFDMDKLTASQKELEVFKECKEDDVRSEVVELHVGTRDFYFEGVFKHTDTHWETRMIPLSILPQNLDVKPAPKKKPDLNMTAERMNAIQEKIAKGMNSGLNAREIEDTFQGHVTKAELIRCIMETIRVNNLMEWMINKNKQES
jgi:hypothetical protein